MNTTIDHPERGVPCFVHHADAGGGCRRPAAIMAYGLKFCREHGEEVVSTNAPAAELRRALVRAYPEAPESLAAAARVWKLEEGWGGDWTIEILLGDLRTLVKLMHVAHAEDRDTTWLVEELELMRESVAARAAYASRDRAGDRPTG